MKRFLGRAGSARTAAMALFAALLAAGCGGGGGTPDACVSGSEQTCAAATNPPPAVPSSSNAWAEVCTLAGARNFTRAYMDEVYLWYSEIPVVDPEPYTNISRYFYDLLTPALDTNGRRKDKFSFVVTGADADSLTTGTITAYGVRWEHDGQGRHRAAFVENGSPAQAAGLARGAELVDVPLSATPDWYPNADTQITFTWRSAPGEPTRTSTISSAVLHEDPVPLVRTVASPAGRQAAYVLFNAHTEGAQDKLIAAMRTVQQAGVGELVLDMRYNGGGYLYTALSLSSMLSGPAVDGQVFEQLRFNDKRQFESSASAFHFGGLVLVGEAGSPAGTPLPRLALPRVYVLTSAGTCSASESVVNGLRGVGVEMVLIGQTTCGKPYGFSRKDNCGLSYFPIEFQGVNAAGFGDYAAGMPPACVVADDFDRALGNTGERLMATALHHMDNGACPEPAALPQSLRSTQRASVPTPTRSVPGKLIIDRR